MLEFLGLCGHEINYRELYLFPEQPAPTPAPTLKPAPYPRGAAAPSTSNLSAVDTTRTRQSRPSFIQQQVIQQQQQQQQRSQVQARLSNKGRGSQQQSLSTASTAASSAASTVSSATSSGDNFAMHDVYRDSLYEDDGEAVDRKQQRPSVLQQNRIRRDGASSPSAHAGKTPSQRPGEDAGNPLHRSASDDIEAGPQQGSPDLARPSSPVQILPAGPPNSSPRLSLSQGERLAGGNLSANSLDSYSSAGGDGAV